MITLQQLIQVTPFTDEMRQEILQQIDTLDENQKYELTDLCWATLIQEAQNKLAAEIQNQTLNTTLSGNPTIPSPQEIENKILEDLIHKFEAQDSDEKINEIREKLHELNSPPPDTLN